MAGYRATNLKFQGYQGHIMLMKVRYGYGIQTHIEKMGILESWYSDLRAALPVTWEKKPEEYTTVKRWGGKTVQELMVDADTRLQRALEMYRPTFEGEDSCDPLEKEFMIFLRGILYLLDEITAISKIIDKVQSDDEGMIVA